ncbi:MAG: integration host factor subunit beta [Bacteroidia bacterium]|nr:integration host factor subunit beta [Bacteroidia bacterium]
MTKAEIVSEISHRTGLEKQDVATVVENFIKVVKDCMITQGDNIYIRGFGSFVIKKRAAKKARVISKKESIDIPEHFIPSFKPAKAFLEKVKESSAVKERYEANLKEANKKLKEME